MKEFIRPISDEYIEEPWKIYKQEMYEHLVCQYEGKISDEESISYIKSLIKEQDERGFWVFVYGTLMKGERNHAQYMSETVFKGHYYLRNYGIYELGCYPGIVRRRNNKVVRELYRIEERHLESLDQLEGEGVFIKEKKYKLKVWKMMNSIQKMKCIPIFIWEI